MAKIIVQEDNMEDVFTDSIYPTIEEAKTVADLNTKVNNLLKKYSFDTELMQVRFMLPITSKFTNLLMQKLGLEFITMDKSIKHQIGWDSVNTWMNDGNFMPMKLINYGDVLNTDLGAVFGSLNVLDKETANWLKTESENILKGAEDKEFEITDTQKTHLESIKEGNFPFGLEEAE